MTLQIIVTNAGRAALLNAAHTGTLPVTVTQVGVSGTAVVPTAAANVLPGEIKRISTIGGAAVAADILHVLVRDESTAAYNMKSFALYLADGTLFAIYGQTDTIISKVAPSIMLLAVDVQFADITATSIAFGDTNFVNPPATTSTPGVVELADDAEAQALADALRALTPRGLSLVFTAAKILQKVVTVDGAGSGLDADLLDGFEASAFAKLAGATFAGGVTVPTVTINAGDVLLSRTNNPWQYIVRPDVAGYRYLAFACTGGAALDQLELGSQLVTRSGSKIWDAANDGAGSGLDADLLDGQHGSYYLAAGNYTAADIRAKLLTVDGSGSGLDADLFDGLDSSAFPKLNVTNVFTGNNRFPFLTLGTVGDLVLYQDSDGGGFGVRVGNVGAYNYFTFSAGGMARVNGSLMWHANNDGAGSGLDADLLDGKDSSAFVQIGSDAQLRDIVAARSANQGVIYLGASLPAYLFYDGTNLHLAGGGLNHNGQLVWDAGTDGAGSGLDADMLDGLDSSAFAKLTGASFTGAVGVKHLSVTDGDVMIARTSNPWGYVLRPNVAGLRLLALAADGANPLDQIDLVSQTVTRVGNRMWDAATDGSGSGLDADLLDGQDGSFYANVLGRLGFTPVQQGTGIGQLGNTVKIGWSPANRIKVTVDASDQGALVTDGLLSVAVLDVNGAQMRRGSIHLWGADNDGAGSGLDADLLDGQDSSFYTNIPGRLGYTPASAGDFQFGSNELGFWERRPNGMIEQWGRLPAVSGEGIKSFTFPIAFTDSGSVNVQLCGTDSSINRDLDCWPQYSSNGVDWCNWYLQFTGASGSIAYLDGVMWRAIGR
jgi:hypothetical protein